MKWIYYRTSDNKHRFALGEVKRKPDKVLFCFGINPSTATPQKLDPTLNRVRQIAINHGYDSWIMLNVYSERATVPDNMAQTQNEKFQKRNIKVIKRLLRKYRNCSDILFAYGDLIGKRRYLAQNMTEIMNIIQQKWYKGNCYCLGKTKSGNARHPLYQKTVTPFAVY